MRRQQTALATALVLILCAKAVQAAPVRISQSVTTNTLVGFSADGLRVVYATPYTYGSTVDLYSARVDGSDVANPIKLNGSGITFGDMGDVTITADNRVFFTSGSAVTSTRGNLFVNSIVGGSFQQLTTGLSLGSFGTDDGIGQPAYRFSPDGSRLAFIDTSTPLLPRLLVMSSSGGPLVQLSLNPPNATEAGVTDFRWAANNTLVYRADRDQNAMYEIYSEPVSGSGTPTKLNFNFGPVAAGGTGLNTKAKQNFFVGNSGTRVLYLADPTHVVGSNASYPYNLYSAPVGGGASVALNPAGTSVSTARNVALAGSNVVFIADTQLCLAPIAPPGGWTGPSILTAVNEQANSFNLASSGNHVVFGASASGSSKNNFYATNLTTLAKVQINDPAYADFTAAPYAGLLGTLFAADGNTVYYGLRCWGGPSDLGSIWKATLDGSLAPQKVSGNGIDIESINGMSPDGRWISYTVGFTDHYLLSTADNQVYRLLDPDGVPCSPVFGPNADEFVIYGTQGGTKYFFSATPTPVPEPNSLIILAAAALGLSLRRRFGRAASNVRRFITRTSNPG